MNESILVAFVNVAVIYRDYCDANCTVNVEKRSSDRRRRLCQQFRLSHRAAYWRRLFSGKMS